MRENISDALTTLMLITSLQLIKMQKHMDALSRKLHSICNEIKKKPSIKRTSRN